jgi:hypothetical protein
VGAVSTELAPASALERNWWLRALLVLAAPHAVFASLRDESDEAVEARQEVLFAVGTLASVSVALVSPTFRRMLNDGAVSVALVPVLAFVAGAIDAAVVYWIGGGLLYGGARRLGSEGSYLRMRHVLALATVPLALSLVTFWPVRIAVYGEDLFRTGGDDYGRSDAIFGGVYLGFVAWSLWLLLVGVRAVHGWTWGRAAAVIAIAAAAPVLIVLATSL